MTTKQKPAKRTSANAEKSTGFTAEERAAMRERAKELKAEANKVDGEKALLAKVAQMKGSDRKMGKRVHELVKEVAPDLTPRTWYGMPAYEKDGKVLCFYRAAAKFKSRYAALGFSDQANLDDGAMWPTDFALKDIGPAEEKKIRALLKKAIS